MPKQRQFSPTLIVAAFILTITIFGTAGYLFYNHNQSQASATTTLTKKIETPNRKSDGTFISTLAEFKVKSESNKYIITYPRGKFKTEELSIEIKKVLVKTDMSEIDMARIQAAAATNEGFYMDTRSECGFDDPSSAWCLRLANDKTAKTVSITVQKGKFDPIVENN